MPPERHKRIRHPAVGDISLQIQSLLDPVQNHTLLVLTATPGSEDNEKLQLLSVLGNQEMESGA